MFSRTILLPIITGTDKRRSALVASYVGLRKFQFQALDNFLGWVKVIPNTGRLLVFWAVSLLPREKTSLSFSKVQFPNSFA